jgi:hypothetical protein
LDGLPGGGGEDDDEDEDEDVPPLVLFIVAVFLNLVDVENADSWPPKVGTNDRRLDLPTTDSSPTASPPWETTDPLRCWCRN